MMQISFCRDITVPSTQEDIPTTIGFFDQGIVINSQLNLILGRTSRVVLVKRGCSNLLAWNLFIELLAIWNAIHSLY